MNITVHTQRDSRTGFIWDLSIFQWDVTTKYENAAAAVLTQISTITLTFIINVTFYSKLWVVKWFGHIASQADGPGFEREYARLSISEYIYEIKIHLFL